MKARLAAAAGLLLALTGAGRVCDAVWHDAARNRDIPVRLRLPEGDGRAPLIVFSPGLGGDIGGGGAWGAAWAAAGFAVLHVQHPGNGPEYYRQPATTPEERRARVATALGGAQLLARIADIGFVRDEVARRATIAACDLRRIDPDRTGIAGHSMGAWTAQAIAGQRWPGGATFRDARFMAALTLSPSPASPLPAAEAFGRIDIPVLAITGTEDGALPTAEPARRQAALNERTAAWRAMPPGDKLLIVFDAADHMVFAGNRRRAERPADAHVTAVTIAATTAFWQATLLGDAKAKAFLGEATGVAALLAPADLIERK